MDALTAIVSVAAVVALIFAVIKLGEHWQVVESRHRDAETLSYLHWDTSQLIELHNKFVDLVAKKGAKPNYLRSLKAINAALEMQQQLVSSPLAKNDEKQEPTKTQAESTSASAHYDWKTGQQTCPMCKWTAVRSQAEIGETFRDGADYHCPKCSYRFGFIPFPLLSESLSDPRAPEADRIFAEIALREAKDGKGGGSAP
jgi:hypothetical protein